MLAFHGIFGAYGFWLPNDPRGSWSSWVGSWDLYRHGPATKVTDRHSLAKLPHDRDQRLAAKQAIRFPPVHFTGQQAKAIAEGFASALRHHEMCCFACAIMPDHVHLVLDSRGLQPGQAIGKLKRAAGDRLIELGLHPFGDLVETRRPPLCFARRAWKVYLDSADDLRRSITYVNQNPVKDGLRTQKWSFVQMPRV